ncbi:unnamed protein product [Menidia menidia]|uniref:(Atlantic silverside) hypothetical protein n=1 Tax=Menidia menidia TaxID=238744 RepID=A0A8S4AQA1_9TELE|nr:unnamed protein product [Menidia menidia]
MVGMKPTEAVPSAAVKFFGAGLAACIADLITFPLDTAKVRLQIQGEAHKLEGAVRYKGVFGTMATMVRTEGPGSLYNGLVAGLQRQMSFASVRIGLYDSMKQFYTRGTDNVVKVRFQAQVRLAEGERRYSSTLDAYRTIARDEGVRGLWRDTLPCHFTAAFGAGFCTTVVASPVDVVKTRYMNSLPGQYTSAMNYFGEAFCSVQIRKQRNFVTMVGLRPSDVPPSAAVKFVGAGTAACIADLVTFPLDTAKVRLQYRGVFGTILTMIRTEGPLSLYSGLVAGLQRQMSFASVRIGLYDSVKQLYTRGSDHVGLGSRLLAGCTTGAMAVALAQPTDVVKVRFQAQAVSGHRAKRYCGTIHAYKTIAREEGYGSVLRCAAAMMTREGPQAFYKGFTPSFLRLGSWNVVMFVTYEQLKRVMMAANPRSTTPL